MAKVQQTTSKTNVSKTNNFNGKSSNLGDVTDYIREDQLEDYVASNNTSDIEKMLTTNMNGVFGIPYQFLPSVDRRLSGTSVGRKYAEKIITTMPLLFITPGSQVFMDDFTKQDSQNILDYLVSGVKDDDASEFVKGSGKYYSFKYDYVKYYEYVNPMIQSVAYYMGIQNEVISIGDGQSNKRIKDIDWSKAGSKAFRTYFSAAENIVFYLDGMTEVSETFSNNTTESSLASTINGYSDTAKEIQFILGSGDSVVGKLLERASTATSSITSSLSSVIGTLGGGILESLANTGVTTVLKGGKIIFPEMWQDSSFERSYSLTIKLRSPDHDSLSIFLNILVPYIHLIALCLPRGAEDDPNAYTSPFLVKAYCKGMFNVDMGLITSMSVTKGAESQWNDDGLPTQIDISLDIKDLYSSLFITGYGDGDFGLFKTKAIVKNTSMMDFLANMAGLNLAQMEIGRRISMFNYLTRNKFVTTPSRLWSRFDQKISNLMNKLYNTI